MYTSGSTGTPKGVPITHGAVVNALSFFARRPGISAADRVLAVTTPTFDISVLELLLPLTVGAHVTIAGIEEVIDGAALSERLTRSGINLLQATPATWSLLLSQGWQGHPSFRAWCGGEALPGTLAAALLERVGELWNFYGPTETTIYSTLKRVRGPEDNGSIGRPIANTAVYVLDARSQPVPVGVPGELWIAGRGVSPGYLNRPDLNVERFQPDPFSGESRARMYRTGDRVRWRYDGELEFLGRVDDQVKLRGFRIEPGEIAGVLLKLESIRQCAVVLREDQPGDPRLVAYLVMARNQTAEQVDPDAMRTHVRQHVPDYMVPSAFLVIDALPLTANGKLDRRALPAPPAISRRLPQPDEASASELELEILSIWREVLGNERVGPQDDFFELGGHSLLALRIQARIRASFGREMPLRILFDARTVAGVAAWVDGSSPP
jgi:acyl-coenzyme A synthetase/AMP-(fatty) acid ligase/acyl carrier protein